VRTASFVLAALTLAAADAAPAATHLLTLYVANQSFDVNPVDIKVTVDGATVAAGTFYAGEGRRWRRYVVRLAAGRHVLRASTRKGAAALRREFDVAGPRWMAVAYRNVSPSRGGRTIRHFAFAIRAKPFRR
jgi:hypothetical protein